MTNRREFLQRAGAIGGTFLLDRHVVSQNATRPAVSPAEKALDILILGGTGLTGPSQVKYALDARPPRHGLQSRASQRPLAVRRD